MPRNAALAVEGTASFSSCSRFPQISIPGSSVMPVRLAAQLSEERAPCAPPARFGEERRRDRRMENRYPALRCRLLRPRRERPCRHRAAQQGDELATLHLLRFRTRVVPLATA